MMSNETTPHTDRNETMARRLTELVELIQSSEAEIEQLVEVINKFPGVGDALVSRANSPEFALRNQISRVEHAIAVLGSRRTVETIRLQHQSHSHTDPHFGQLPLPSPGEADPTRQGG